ncbi:unnamed protein product [Coccothraustes coccothraustes]
MLLRRSQVLLHLSSSVLLGVLQVDHRYCAETESASGRQSRFFALVGSRTGLCDGALTFPFEGVTWRAFGKGRGVAAEPVMKAVASERGRSVRPEEPGPSWQERGPQVLRRDRVSKWPPEPADHRYCAETESASGRQSRFVALVGSRTGLCDGALTFPFEGVTWRAFGKGRGVAADHRYCAETESASGRQSRFVALVGSRTGLCDGALTFPFEGVTWRAFGKGRGVAADHRYCAETESASGRQSRFVALVGSRTGLCDGALTFPFEGVTWRAFGKGRGVAAEPVMKAVASERGRSVRPEEPGPSWQEGGPQVLRRDRVSKWPPEPADHRYCAETESASGRQSRFVALVGSRTGLCDGALTFPFEGVTWRAFGKGRGVAAEPVMKAVASERGRSVRPEEPGPSWQEGGPQVLRRDRVSKWPPEPADHRYCAETESASGRQSRFVALVGSRTGLCDGALTFPFEGVTWRAFGKGRGVAAEPVMKAVASERGRSVRPEEPGPSWQEGGPQVLRRDRVSKWPPEPADHRYCAETESASGRQSRFVALVGSRTGLCDGALTFPFEGVTWRAFGKGRGVAAEPVMKAVASERGRSVRPEEPGPSWQEGGPQVLRRDRVSKWPPEPADHRYCAETESASGRQSRFVALVGSRTGLCDGALTFPFEGVTWRAFGKGRGVAAEPVMKAVASERGRSVRPEEPGPSWQEGGPQVLRRDRVSKWPPEPADHRYCAETESASGRQSRFVALVGSRTGLCDGALTFPFEGVTWRAFGKGRGVAAEPVMKAVASERGRSVRPEEPGPSWQEGGPQVLRRDRVSKWPPEPADHRYCAETESASGRQSRFVALVGSRTGLCDGALTFPFEGVTWRAFGKGRGVAAEPVMKAVASERGRSVRPEEPGPSWQEALFFAFIFRKKSQMGGVRADHRYCAETESASGRQSRFVALVGSRTGLCDGALTFPFEGVTWRAFGKGRGVAADHRYCAETESASGRQSRFVALVGSRTGLCDGALTFPFEGVTWRAFGKGRGVAADHRYCAETESASGRQSRFVALVGSRTGLCDGALTFPFEGVTWRAFGKGRGVAAEPVMKAVASERGRSVRPEEPGPSWQEGGPQVLRRDRVSKWPPEPADHRYCAETESASGRQSRFVALVGSRTGLCDGALTFPFEGVTWRAFGKGRGVAADHRYCAETESASGRQSRFVALVGSRTGLCDGALTFPFEGVTWRAFGKGRGVAAEPVMKAVASERGRSVRPEEPGPSWQEALFFAFIFRKKSQMGGVRADHRYCAETESASGRQSRFVALVGSRTGLCDGALTFPFEGVTWRAFGKGRGVAAEPVMKAVASERGRSVRPEEPGPSWQEALFFAFIFRKKSQMGGVRADHRYCAETESASGRQSRFVALVGSRTGLCDGALTFPFEGVTWRAFGKGRGVAAEPVMKAVASERGRSVRPEEPGPSWQEALFFAFIFRKKSQMGGVRADHRYCAETESASGRQSRFFALVGSRTGLCDGALTFPFEGVTWRAFGKGRGVAADHRYCAETESASGRQSRFFALVGSRTGLCDGALTFPFEGVTWRAFGKGRGVAADHRYCAETESASGRQSRFFALVGSRTGLCDGALTFPFEGVTWRAFGKGRGVAADHRYCAETESASGRQSRFVALVGSRTGLCDGALTFPFEGVTWRAFGKGRGVAAEPVMKAVASERGRSVRPEEPGPSWQEALFFAFIFRKKSQMGGVRADHRYCAETESASGRQSRFVALVGSRTGLCDGALTFPFEGVTWRAFGKGRGVAADHRYCAETESASGRQSRFVALVGSRTGLCDGALTFPFEGVTWRAFGKGRGVAADHRYCAETESASGRQSRFVALVGSRTGLCDGALTFPFEGVTWRAFGKGRGVAADHRYCAETESASGRQSRFVALVGSRTGLCDGALTFPFEGVTWRAFGKGRGVAAEPVMKAVASERGRSVGSEEPGPSWQEGEWQT